MKSILDPTFRYVPSASTDIRKTFARIRRERKQAASEMAEGRANAAGTTVCGNIDANVAPLTAKISRVVSFGAIRVPSAQKFVATKIELGKK